MKGQTPSRNNKGYMNQIKRKITNGETSRDSIKPKKILQDYNKQISLRLPKDQNSRNPSEVKS